MNHFPQGEKKLLNYAVYLPKGYEAEKEKAWPLLIFLHGYGERSNQPDALERVRIHGPLAYIDEGHDLPFIIVAPLLTRDFEYWPSELIDLVIRDAVKNYRVDPDRLLLTGLSLGGFATWAMGVLYPQRFAALVPIAAGDIFKDSPAGGGIPAISESPDQLCRLKNIPIRVFHGDRDPVVSLDGAVKMVERMKACGGDISFTIFEDTGHDSWSRPYGDPELYRWLEGQRKPFP